MTDPDSVVINLYTDEAEFRREVRVGDWVLAGRSRQYTLAPHTKYITQGLAYQVLHTAVVEAGFCLRTTTDIPNQATYLSWPDLDIKDPNG